VAPTLGPSRRHLLRIALLLSAIPHPAAAALPAPDDPWLRVVTANFTLFGNASESQIRGVGLELERFRAVLLRLTKGLTANAAVPTSVYVFQSDRALGPYKPRADGKPQNLSAYFVPGADGNVIALAASAAGVRSRSVYHEYLHFFMSNNFAPQPRWYEEGAAEYYSSFRVNGARARVGLPVEEHVALLRRTPLMPLERLFGVEGESPEYTQAPVQGLFYAQSWALVHYLTHGGRPSGELADFLGRAGAGQPVETAFRSAFRTTFREMLSELTRYVRGAGFPHTTVDLAALAVPGEMQTFRMTRAETLVHLGNLLTRISGDDLHGAEAHFQAVLSADPCEPEALAGLGFLRLRQDREVEAADLLRSAMESGSRDFRAPFHFGSLLVRSLPEPEGTMGEAERTTLERAREAFRRSVEWNGAFLEARAALGRTYLWEIEERAAEGIPHLEAAARGLRSRTDLAMDLASLYEAAGEIPRSEELLREALGANAERVIQQKRRTAAFRRSLRGVNDLLADRKEVEALALLERLVAETSGEVREALEEQVAPLREGIGRTLAVRRYNEAIEKVGKPDYAGALAAFREVAAMAPDPELARKARDRADQIARYLAWEKERRPARPKGR
jgi:tetratricopeptide (TPR) repeat protein